MDVQALIDTAEGAHEEVVSLLQRMRELAVQSINDTNSSTDLASLNAEYAALETEIDRIGATTSWAGIKLLDESACVATDGVLKLQSWLQNFFRRFYCCDNQKDRCSCHWR
jgi:flagellin